MLYIGELGPPPRMQSWPLGLCTIFRIGESRTKPSFPTVTGRGPHPSYTYIASQIIFSRSTGIFHFFCFDPTRDARSKSPQHLVGVECLVNSTQSTVGRIGIMWFSNEKQTAQFLRDPFKTSSDINIYQPVWYNWQLACSRPTFVHLEVLPRFTSLARSLPWSVKNSWWMEWRRRLGWVRCPGTGDDEDHFQIMNMD